MKPLGVTAEGRVGEKPARKKGFNPLWLVVVVLTVIVLALAGILISQQMGEKGADVPSASNSQKTTTAGTIKVPEGPTIKVVFKGPPELKASWQKTGMEGFQLHLVGTLKNVSNQTIKFSEIAFLIDGKQVDFLWGQTLAPGEEMPIAKGLVGYSETTKQLMVEVKGVQKVGEPTNDSVPPLTQPWKPQGRLVFDGEMKVYYIEDPSAKGKIELVRVYHNPPSPLFIEVRNKTNEPLTLKGSKSWKDQYGAVVDDSVFGSTLVKQGGITTFKARFGPGETLEFTIKVEN